VPGPDQSNWPEPDNKNGDPEEFCQQGIEKSDTDGKRKNEEVLHQQSEAIQTFLLQPSILISNTCRKSNFLGQGLQRLLK
jgi:hypothetical protein